MQDVRAVLARTMQIVAETKRLLADTASDADRRGPWPVPRTDWPVPRTKPPDDLCALFDALLEAARSADAYGDLALSRLVEDALQAAGERIEATAAALGAGRDGPPGPQRPC